MKTWVRISLMLVVLASFAGSALAHNRARVGVTIGFGPAWYYTAPYYYPPPVYYVPPPVIVTPPPPPVYIEKPAAPPPAYDWYYCEPAKAYYPYVKDCPTAWRGVPAQPLGQ